MKIAVSISHRVLGESLARVLKEQYGARSVSMLSRDGEYRADLSRARPELLILDGYLYALPALAADLATILEVSPETRVILLANDHPELLRTAIELGVMGLVSPVAGLVELQRAIEQVVAGHSWLPHAMVSGLMSGRVSSRSPSDTLNRLSVRQRQVFDLIGSGLSTREIADVMGVSVKTVETHRARLMQTMELKRANDLVRLATRLSSHPVTG
jgi:DNA-binding NarL/FixJ family response regulator